MTVEDVIPQQTDGAMSEDLEEGELEEEPKVAEAPTNDDMNAKPYVCRRNSEPHQTTNNIQDLSSSLSEQMQPPSNSRDAKYKQEKQTMPNAVIGGGK